ncbi:YibE/F family protein [Candidatus Woesebacteria bacterium CG_4_9_14_3_um_filter_39_10]|uniref:YibE/F family protein n=2 Tax=Candidatus Woeseibacteriota TaxID=1752722 RepID=A0A2M7XA85_9BACT|nr:MAG: YibE/F family protein [Candidatus Woesebacteria bacterium CG06_land_8_20_14_3_00_39_27]PJA43087.1 MAG: YibE/F family protein [Candidatus Woesebacteria bacterium CG_4_9_14_3_um_filter_39_10]
MRVKQFLLTVVTLLFSFVLLGNSAYAQSELPQEPPKEETLEAVVEKILDGKQIKPMGSEDFQLYQKLELLVTKGSLKDKKITIENGNIPVANNLKYKVNDKVIVTFSKDFEGNDSFYITDYIRRDSLVWLFLIFVVSAVVIAKWRGILSLVGMGVSFLVIFSFILPKILSGSNPVEIAILGSLIIIPVSFFLSHGFNKKTMVAIAGTLVALIITGVLANIFVEAAKLTGFASEEAGFLQVAKGGLINIRGLLLAGIIIGVLGVLDDITISQSAIVFQLKEANEKLKFNELYKRAMNVGQDHISSMVNTLVLVYTGAALPLLLLFIDNPHPFSEIINYEIIADEIVRTLVGSIGLVLAVPITTVIASLVAEKTKAGH